MIDIDDIASLLLAHVYLASNESKDDYRPNQASVRQLMDDYPVGGSIINAAIADLSSNGRLLRFETIQGAHYSISSVGIREVQAALKDPNGSLLALIHTHSKAPEDLIRRLGVVPAADRVVTLNHNSEPYKQAIEALDQTIEAVRASNDLGQVSADQRDAVVAELSAVRRMIEATKVRAGQVLSFAAPAFEFIAKAFTQEGIKRAAAVAWDALKSLFT